MISPEYKKVLEQTRTDYPNWGNTAHRHAHKVEHLVNKFGIRSILDFGAGTGSLKEALGHLDVEIVEYDPGVPGLDVLKNRAYDMVVSIDVLEHVEPDFLDVVLRTTNLLARRVVYHHICTEKAVKHLSDGRNAHLIVEDHDWWEAKLTDAYGPSGWLLDSQDRTKLKLDIVFNLPLNR